MKNKTTTIVTLSLVAVLIVIGIMTQPFKSWANYSASVNAANVLAGDWKTIQVEEIADNAYSLFHHDWAAVAVGKEGDMNAMTISWGTLGSLWGKPVVTVYISPDRYTHSFMERNEYFTVTVFTEEHRDKLRYIGTKSGRDGDKIKDAGLTAEYTALGNPTFREGRLLMECKIIYSQQFDVEQATLQMPAYSNGLQVHHYYIGEIVNVQVKE